MPRVEQQPEVEPLPPEPGRAALLLLYGARSCILQRFTPQRPVLSIKEIANELGMRPSTTHRYMSTLVALGYLKQGPSRKYRLTLAVTRLGMSALSATSLREHARLYLEDLRQRTSYTTGIAVLDGPEILYIDHLPSKRRGCNSLDLVPGSRLPVHCTAMGKVLLASLPETQRQALIAELGLKRQAPNTITSKPSCAPSSKSWSRRASPSTTKSSPRV